MWWWVGDVGLVLTQVVVGQASFFFFFLVFWNGGGSAAIEIETPSVLSPTQVLLMRSVETHESSNMTLSCCKASIASLARLSVSGLWVCGVCHRWASLVAKKKSMRMMSGTSGSGVTHRWASLACWIAPTKIRFHACELASPFAIMRPW